ncbi:MAG TPA: response regulator [Verrucomicrobiae bacterium]|nr:response regulator [Verrucomicrobiae bacterium]
MAAPAKILIVEDNPLNLELATDLLEVAGYAILQATTAERGIQLARSLLPDLILMDTSLPGMDGVEATKILKSDAATEHIPVVSLTANAMKGDEETARAAGALAYVTKPIDTRTFVKDISRFLPTAKSSR